jgi:hypothetical protein
MNEMNDIPPRPTGPKTNIRVKLVGEDGNAFAILARVRSALRRGGRADLVEPFTKEATSGNYTHLLATVMEYVEVD